MRRGQRAVVAVSGGVDSMALLHLLHALGADFEWKLSVAHFNHRLRGPASDADERFVCAEARKLGLTCDVGRGNVRRKAGSESVSIEMAGRELRHAFLARCARRRGAQVVVLAQHADDQVELFLMRLLRGSGGIGLGGMRAQSPSPADRRIRLVRPLLEFSKSDLVDFAQARQIRFRVDASNLSDEFDRNWVRLKVLPMLRQRHATVERTLSRTMRIAQADSDFVREAAKSWLGTNRPGHGVPQVPYQALHVAVQRQVVQEQLVRLGCEPDFQLIEWLRLQPGKPISIAAGHELVRDETGTVGRARHKSPRFIEAQAVIEIPQGPGVGRTFRGQLDFGGITLKWSLLRRKIESPPAGKRGVEFFDLERVGAFLLLRHWRPGDQFQPIGLPSATKLQDWFTNRKIPAARRRQLVLAETEAGEVFWVEGERIGEVAKVTGATRRVLELRWQRG